MKKDLVVILGAGESGVGAALLAVKENFKVWVSDYSTIKDEFRNELTINNIPFEERGHDFEKVKEAKWIIKSPGIPEKADIIQKLRAIEASIISEIEFASMFNNARIVAVTGSNGKTTVSSLVYHLLKEAGKAAILAGNIGKSFSRVLAEGEDFDIAVIEISSFQLDDIVGFKPEAACILNISPDHLDRYDYKMENYAGAKWKITSNQDENDLLVLNSDDEWIAKKHIRVGSSSKVVWLSAGHQRQKLDSMEFRHNLKGRHNDYNVAVAIELTKSLGLDEQEIRKGLLSFSAIEHRLESVAFINGVEYINDSKATNVDAVYYALDAMEKPVVWIAGGTDKGNDYNDIMGLVKQKVKALVCLGVDNSKLIKAFSESSITVRSTDNIADAVTNAFELANRNDIVLLSPACASFDLFENYEQRGKLFKKEVFDLISNVSN